MFFSLRRRTSTHTLRRWHSSWHPWPRSWADVWVALGLFPSSELWLSSLLLTPRMLQTAARGSDMKGNLRSKVSNSRLIERFEKEKKRHIVAYSCQCYVWMFCFFFFRNSQETESTLKRTWKKWKAKWNRYIFPQTFKKSSSKPQSFTGIKADLIMKQTLGII